MKILITGANGRIGRNLVRSLAPQHELVLLGRQAPAAAMNHTYYQLDIEDQAGLNRVISDEAPQAIIHLAALLPAACTSSPKKAHRINVEATDNLARLAAANGVKTFVFASTSTVYHQTELSPTDEEHNVNPQTIYGQTKLAAEEKMETVSKQKSTKFMALRLFNIYGEDFDDSLIYKLVHSTPDKPALLYGPDNFYRDYVHIDDVCSAFSRALDSTKAPFEVLNIASGKTVSNRQLIDRLEKIGTPVYFRLRKVPTTISWADITRSTKVINWKPERTIEETVNDAR